MVSSSSTNLENKHKYFTFLEDIENATCTN